MDDQHYDFATFPYPSPPNILKDDITPTDQAIYVPSVSPNYATSVYAQNWKRALPKGVNSGDLNFLDQSNGLFKISHVMSSAGQALNQKRDCIITKRDRSKTVMIGDSGGYQIAHNKLAIKDDSDRLKILHWLETHANVAMTLDIPTGPLLKGGYFYSSFEDCLDTTFYNLKYFDRKRSAENVWFLNVLAGNDQVQSDAWYDKVKTISFEGWAFGGILRHNFYLLCRRILIMFNEEQIQDKKWIHVLGTNVLETAVLLTALQRSINRHINPNLRISYDTSSPFRNLGWGNVYGLPNFNQKSMVMPMHKVLSSTKFFDCGVRWPWKSPLGDHMTMGDVCIAEALNRKSYLDVQSNIYLAHHNLAALCFAVAEANRAFDASNLSHSYSIAKSAGEAVKAIDEIMRTKDFEVLERHRPLFEKLWRGKTSPKADDEERDLSKC